jgi:hypothetical protein
MLKSFSCGPVAQLVEQLTLNQRVAGSSPARLTTYFIFDLWQAILAAVCSQAHSANVSAHLSGAINA